MGDGLKVVELGGSGSYLLGFGSSCDEVSLQLRDGLGWPPRLILHPQPMAEGQSNESEG